MKKLTIENAKELQPYIDMANYNEYNSNIVTMLMWNNAYHIMFKTFPNYALVLWKNGKELMWMMPLCKKEDRKQAVDMMMKYSEEFGASFCMTSLIEEFKEWCVQIYGDTYIYRDLIAAQDYVYDVVQQRDLVGKKMQKRRNHYNAFLKEYEGRFTFKPLGEEDFDAVYELLEKWKQGHESADSIERESVGIRFLFDHFKELSLIGGCIYIDGQLEAFNIASHLSQTTLQMHVEKANKNIRGLYVAVLKHFLQHIPEQYTLINREDDMGLAYLRKAKTDMKPCLKIRKYCMQLRDIQIRKANQNDKEALASLWMQSFPDETASSTAFYFEHMWKSEDTYVLMNGNDLVTMLQRRKMNVSLHDKQYPVSFIVGVATEETYQGQGFMRQLLLHALEDCKEEAFVLLQAYNWDLYKPYGFVESHYRQRTTIDTQAYIAQDDYHVMNSHKADELLFLYESYTAHKTGYRIRDIAYYQDYYIPYTYQEGGEIKVLYKGEEALGYAIVYESEEQIFVTEFIVWKEENIKAMIGALKQQDKKMIIDHACDLTLDGQSVTMPCMMIKIHNKDIEIPSSMFINEVL